MSLDDIDFAERYRQHLQLASYRPKPARECDRRALTMHRKPLGGHYADAFIARMDLDGARSLLDIGCGPGTLCLTLAPRLEEICALDYSPAMLALLNDNAEALNLDNVHQIGRTHV